MALRAVLHDTQQPLEWLMQHQRCDPAVVSRLLKATPLTRDPAVSISEMRSIESYLRKIPPLTPPNAPR